MMHRCIKLTDHGVLAPSRLPRPGHSVRFRFGFSTAWPLLHFGTAGGLYSMEWEWQEGVETDRGGPESRRLQDPRHLARYSTVFPQPARPFDFVLP
jgi:hypothetical protein